MVVAGAPATPTAHATGRLEAGCWLAVVQRWPVQRRHMVEVVGTNARQLHRTTFLLIKTNSEENHRFYEHDCFLRFLSRQSSQILWETDNKRTVVGNVQ